MKKVLFFSLFFVIITAFVFADLSSNITAEIIDNSTRVEIRNFNYVPVFVSFTVTYNDENTTRFDHKTIRLGERRLSNSIYVWSASREIQILYFEIESVDEDE